MDEKNVQTPLPRPLYEALVHLARQRRRPLEAVVREAVEEYVRRENPVHEDPLLSFVGHGRLRGRKWSKHKDWRA